jgi:hypothetical protein
MPFPDEENSSSLHTISEEFVFERLESDEVELDPTEQRAAHSESGVN